MLKKLLKYEFKATGRTIIPVSGLVLLLSIINAFLLGHVKAGATGIGVKLVGIVTFAYALAIMALVVIVLMALIMRFYKSNFGNEGYLTHTLPITNMQEITNKIISGIVWTFLATLVVTLSIMFIMVGSGDISFSAIFKGLGELWRDSIKYLGGGNTFLFLLEGIILIIVGFMSNITQIYVSIAAGHSFKKAKVLMSFLSYFVINVVTVIIMIILGSVFGDSFSLWLDSFNDINTLHAGMWSVIISCMIQNVVFVWGTKYLLDNKLNLE